MALTDDQIARAYGYAAALQDRDGIDAQVGAAFLEVMKAYMEQRDALRQYADAENWGYYDGSGCPKGGGGVEEACFIGPDVAREALGLVTDTDAPAPLDLGGAL